MTRDDLVERPLFGAPLRVHAGLFGDFVESGFRFFRVGARLADLRLQHFA